VERFEFSVEYCSWKETNAHLFTSSCFVGPDRHLKIMSENASGYCNQRSKFTGVHSSVNYSGVALTSN